MSTISFISGSVAGPALLAHWPSLALQAGRVQGLIGRYHAVVIIGMRFAYDLRIAGPILIGALGWAFGHVAEAVFADIRDLEGWLLLGLAGLGLAAWMSRNKWPR